MESASVRSLHLLVLSAGLIGCQAKIPGTYELDFEQTKALVVRAAQAHPEERGKQEQTLALLAATRLMIRLDEGGKLESRTELTTADHVTPGPRFGTWKRDANKVTLQMEENADTACDVDGKRLRCVNPSAVKLFQSYVLVRK